MTFDGIREFQTQNYVINDNKIILGYSQFINLEKVDLDIIDYYINNNMQIQIFAEDIEKIEKEGRLTPPDLKLSLLMNSKKDKGGKNDDLIEMRSRAKTDLNQAK